MINGKSVHLSPVAISQSMDIAVRYFSENMGHPEPIRMVIIENCPKLLRIYGISFVDLAVRYFQKTWTSLNP